MQPDQLMTRSLRESPRGRALAQIMATALDAVDPDRAVRRFLRRDHDALYVGDRAYDVRRLTRIFVVGAGKAGAPMAAAAADILAARPQAMQLRYLQTLSNIAGDRTNTIVFPMPGELLNLLMRHDKPGE